MLFLFMSFLNILHAIWPTIGHNVDQILWGDVTSSVHVVRITQYYFEPFYQQHGPEIKPKLSTS